MIERPRVGMATFARFYDATAPQKVTIVRDARTFWIDPRGYAQRDYYLGLRNTLKATHWDTDDISKFEDALDSMLALQINPSKQAHYREVSKAYITYWRKHDAHYFEVEQGTVEIAGLTVLVTPEIGMRRDRVNLALKLWLPAPRPKRQYRQAIQYLMDEAQRHSWRLDLQPALWDVRRQEILPRVPLPKDFALAVAGQAMAFQQIWDALSAVE